MAIRRKIAFARATSSPEESPRSRRSSWFHVGPLITFREYSLGDKIAYLRGEEFSMKHLEEPMLDDDLTTSIREIDVPLFVLQGRYDLQTDFETAVAYYEQIRAPQKELIVFEESAHLVPYEEPEKFMRVLVDRVRPLARD
jgi:proline iminopeptidase